MAKKSVKKKNLNKKVAKKEKPQEVCEIFEVEDSKGKEKIIKKCAEVESKPPTKTQIDYENKLLRNIFIAVGAVIIIFIAVYFLFSSANHFKYRGVTFDVVQEKDLTFYKTSFPAVYQGNNVDYNFYIRNDPRALDKEVPFDGEQNLLPNMVINMTEDFNCDGDGVIAIANFLKFYQFIGTNVVKDPNASCDSEDRYMFVRIQEGNSTKIKQTGTACYEIDVNNCEILKATERFMVESFVDVKKAGV